MQNLKTGSANPLPSVPEAGDAGAGGKCLPCCISASGYLDGPSWVVTGPTCIHPEAEQGLHHQVRAQKMGTFEKQGRQSWVVHFGFPHRTGNIPQLSLRDFQ